MNDITLQRPDPALAGGNTSKVSTNAAELMTRLEEVLHCLETAVAPRPLAVEKGMLSKLIGCPERQIDRLVSAGEMPPPVKLGVQKTVWVLATIEAWLNVGCPDVKTFEKIRNGRR